MKLFNFLRRFLPSSPPINSSSFNGRRNFLASTGSVAAVAVFNPGSLVAGLDSNILVSTSTVPPTVSVGTIYKTRIAQSTGLTEEELMASPAFRRTAIQVIKAWRNLRGSVVEQLTTGSAQQVAETAMSGQLHLGEEAFRLMHSTGISPELFFDPIEQEYTLTACEVSHTYQAETRRLQIIAERVAKNSPELNPTVLRIANFREALINAENGIPPIERLPGTKEQWVKAIQKSMDLEVERRAKELIDQSNLFRRKIAGSRKDLLKERIRISREMPRNPISLQIILERRIRKLIERAECRARAKFQSDEELEKATRALNKLKKQLSLHELRKKVAGVTGSAEGAIDELNVNVAEKKRSFRNHLTSVTGFDDARRHLDSIQSHIEFEGIDLGEIAGVEKFQLSLARMAVEIEQLEVEASRRI